VRRGGFIGSWWGNRRETGHWGDLGVDGSIIVLTQYCAGGKIEMNKMGWACGAYG